MLNALKMVVWHVTSPVSYAIPWWCTPSKKNPGSAPAEYTAPSRHSSSCFSLLFLNKYFVKIKLNEVASAIISVLAS